MLEEYFDRPITDASEALGVSTTIVKRLCRKYGITRWPYRQMNAINKTIVMLREQVLSLPVETNAESETKKLEAIEVMVDAQYR